MKQLAAYAYRKVSGSQTSAQVEFRNVRLGSSASDTPIEGKKYSYDSLGNITLISQSTGSYYPLIAYEYDSQNQLTKETYYDGEGIGSAHVTDTYEYTYDTAGNILSEKKNGTVTKTYTYGDSQWKDKLTAVNGQAITYDACGNPTVYHNGTNLTYEMSWTDGRQLSFFECYNAIQLRSIYTYDADGIRTRRDIEVPGDSWTYYYVTQNGRVVQEIRDGNNDTKILNFIYDESGRPFALKYSANNGRSFSMYYYVLNLQGDVVKLINENGATYASYTYDAWGKVLTATGSLAEVNPLRYRGYYYDIETEFYYLQSRYYDPATHRFINADGYASTGQGFIGTNMFAYCNNNPTAFRDSDGTEPVEIIDLNGDGEADCYIYEYSYCLYAYFWITCYYISVPVDMSGYVCFYVGGNEKLFDSQINLPEKYAGATLVGDMREQNRDNPNMQVYNSYKIEDISQRREIVSVMKQYDKEYPSTKAWGRTEKSLLKEWEIHNWGYNVFSYKSARSTDFDHNEEGWGWFDYLLKFMDLK